jgi:hypothetical protein
MLLSLFDWDNHGKLEMQHTYKKFDINMCGDWDCEFCQEREV